MKNLKQILANKNVVTIIGALLIALVLYGFYTWKLNQATSPVKIPYANREIPARTKITDEMISYLDIPQAYLKGNILTNKMTEIVGKYTNVSTIIPAGSFFYDSAVIEERELPDSYLINIPEGMISYNFSVDVRTTYGNSMYPGNYVDVYFKGEEQSKVLLGKMIENVRILAVKDGNGDHVFESNEQKRIPSQVVLAVTNEMQSLLRRAEYIKNVEIILIPSNVSYVSDDPNTVVTSITSEYIREYIRDRSIEVAEGE